MGEIAEASLQVYREPCPPPQPRRGAVIPLSNQDLHFLLGLPEGWTVRAVRDDYSRMGLDIHVEGEDERLPRLVPNAVAPMLDGAWERETVVVDGKVFVHWNWVPDVG